MILELFSLLFSKFRYIYVIFWRRVGIKLSFSSLSFFNLSSQIFHLLFDLFFIILSISSSLDFYLFEHFFILWWTVTFSFYLFVLKYLFLHWQHMLSLLILFLLMILMSFMHIKPIIFLWLLIFFFLLKVLNHVSITFFESLLSHHCCSLCFNSLPPFFFAFYFNEYTILSLHSCSVL